MVHHPYLRAAEYARRVSVSERTVWALVTRGLPTIGRGKSRRIDVARADEWLRVNAIRWTWRSKRRPDERRGTPRPRNRVESHAVQAFESADAEFYIGTYG
jgi:hypothetical protein